jgi:hypothetical protein
MDTPHMPTMLETLAALRGAYADLPAAKLAAMLPQLDPETAACVQAMLTACDACEAPRNAAIAPQQAASTAAGLATGAPAQGTSLQKLIIAPRIVGEEGCVRQRRVTPARPAMPSPLAGRRCQSPR